MKRKWRLRKALWAVISVLHAIKPVLLVYYVAGVFLIVYVLAYDVLSFLGNFSATCHRIQHDMQLWWANEPFFEQWQIPFMVAVTIILLAQLVLVVCVDFQERRFAKKMPEPLEKPIDTNHGDDLETVMEEIRYEDYEYAAAFNIEGCKLGEQTICSPKNFIADFPIKPGDILVHNHPGWDEISLSSRDIRTMLKFKLKKSIVVTAHYTYSLENPYWDEDLCLSPDEAGGYFNGILEVRSSYLHLLLNLLTDGYHSRRATLIAARKTAEEYGLVYRVKSHRIERAITAVKSFLTPKRLAIVASCYLMFLPLIGAKDISVATISHEDQQKCLSVQKAAIHAAELIYDVLGNGVERYTETIRSEATACLRNDGEVIWRPDHVAFKYDLGYVDISPVRKVFTFKNNSGQSVSVSYGVSIDAIGKRQNFFEVYSPSEDTADKIDTRDL